MNWTRAKEKLLADLWVKQELTQSQIATRMGTTKNAIAGRIYWLGLQKKHRPSHWRHLKKAKQPLKAKNKEKAVAKTFARFDFMRRGRRIVGPRYLPKTMAVPPDAKGVTILARKANECAYPIGDRVFCGAPVCDKNGATTSWCDYHWSICYERRR